MWSLLHISLNGTTVQLAALLEHLFSSDSFAPMHTVAYNVGYALGVGCFCTACQAMMHSSSQRGATTRHWKVIRICVRLAFAVLMVVAPHFDICTETEVVQLSVVQAMLLFTASACDFVLEAHGKKCLPAKESMFERSLTQSLLGDTTTLYSGN